MKKDVSLVELLEKIKQLAEDESIDIRTTL